MHSTSDTILSFKTEAVFSVLQSVVSIILISSLFLGTNPSAKAENSKPLLHFDLRSTIIVDAHTQIKPDTFPPRWFQNFIYRLKTKNQPLPEYVNTDPLFPENFTYQEKSPCEVAFEGYDPAIRETIKQLSFQTLFTHTHEEVKKYYPGQELLRAEGRLTRRDGGYTDLTLKFTWAAENPSKYYGNFRNKNPIEIKLSQDRKITIYNRSPASWKKSDDGKHFEMTANYSLHSQQKKLLQKHSIMHMRVYWERGYQDYQIYNIGMLMNQLECL